MIRYIRIFVLRALYRVHRTSPIISTLLYSTLNRAHVLYRHPVMHPRMRDYSPGTDAIILDYSPVPGEHANALK